MKSLASRLLASAVMAVLLWVMLSGATTASHSTLEPDKVIILSTTDVKGKTGPCG
jgi:hypothetical protein